MEKYDNKHTVRELNLDGADDLMEWIAKCLEFDNSTYQNSISISMCCTAHAWGSCYTTEFNKNPMIKDAMVEFDNGDVFEYLGDGQFDLHKRE